MQTLTLRQKQSLFTRLYAELILWVFSQGWELTLGESFNRSGRGHMFNSLHYIGLAADLNLFVKGHYMSDHCPEWDKIGEKWKSMHPLCKWGGDFTEKDYNHISLLHEGRA